MEAVRTYTAQVMPSLKAVNFNYFLSAKNKFSVQYSPRFRVNDTEYSILTQNGIILESYWRKKVTLCIIRYT